MTTFENIAAAVNAIPTRSAWNKGVKRYAMELLDFVNDNASDSSDLLPENIGKLMLNGSSDWAEYSYNGGALIYDELIANRLCTPTELERTHYGERFPNNRENWLDVQARALSQAAALIVQAARNACFC